MRFHRKGRREWGRATAHTLHFVFPGKKDSTNTPIVIMFNLSCKENAKSPSSNNCFHSYLLTSNDITEILTRFRTQKQTLKRHLHRLDRDETRYFWLRGPTDKTSLFSTYRYRFKSVLELHAHHLYRMQPCYNTFQRIIDQHC